MIIRYPTGLYNNVIPSYNDVGNITYLISNTAPPRSNSTILKIPRAIDSKIRVIPDVPYNYKRKAAGALVFTVSSSNRSETGVNSFQYESGTILEFDDVIVTEVNDISSPVTTQIRHDSFYSDLESYGVDSQKINDSANIAYQKLSTLLNDYKKSLFDARQLIQTYQSNINELTRTISSLNILVEYDNTVQDSIDHLNDQLVDYQAMMASQITLADNYSDLIDSTTDKIRSLAMVVR